MATTPKDLMEAGRTAAPSITPAEAKVRLAAGTAIAVDVRDDSEVAESGKVTGALCTPRGHLEAKIDPASPGFVAGLDPKKTILVYCRSGGRATLAAKTFKDMGYPDVRILGGFDDWVAAGGAVEGMGGTGDA